MVSYRWTQLENIRSRSWLNFFGEEILKQVGWYFGPIEVGKGILGFLRQEKEEELKGEIDKEKGG